MTDLISHFKTKYRANIEQSSKRIAIRKPVSVTDWNFDAYAYIQHEYEQAVEITLSQHDFRTLLETDYYREMEARDQDYNRKIVEMLRADERIRDNNPAVAIAYKKYLMLLELARK